MALVFLGWGVDVGRGGEDGVEGAGGGGVVGGGRWGRGAIEGGVRRGRRMSGSLGDILIPCDGESQGCV